jgi:ribosomal-protein-alanine N-acetyltransferase
MTEKTVTLRPMKEDDISIIYEIERMSFPYPFGEVLIGNIYYAAPELCYIVEHEQEIVGFLLGGYTATPRQAHILSFAIKPNYRGKGLGRKILEYFLEKTSILGYSSIKLEVQVDNKKAIKLYEELGFKMESRIRKYYQDDSDAFLMIKYTDSNMIE